MNNKHLPAFPVAFNARFHTNGNNSIDDICTRIDGLTKRELIATHVLNGLIAQCDPGSWKPNEMQYLASQAVEFTDALLTELSKTENDLP